MDPSPDSNADRPAIECRQLNKTYPGGVEAVRELDLEVRRGECFGLLGPNGAGKTTTIEILEGLLEPTSGSVRILDREWRGDGRELREHLGITLQETRLSEKLTVLETVRLFRSFYRRGLDPERCIELVSLADKRDARVGKLSGGQKQRLSVACGLVGDPELLFLDEPTTGLDPTSRRELWDIVISLRARGRTVLLTTHYMDEAERLCDRVAVVDRGKIIALGAPPELIARLGGEHVISFSTQGEFEGLEVALAELEAVSGVRRDGEDYVLTVDQPHVALPEVLAFLSSRGIELSRLTTRHASLEDVFLELTGRSLSDEEPVLESSSSEVKV